MEATGQIYNTGADKQWVWMLWGGGKLTEGDSLSPSKIRDTA